jgi:uncharacterized membrane protein
MTIEINTSKMIGGIGAFLILISIFASFLPIPYLFEVMLVVGAVLILAGLYGLSDHYQQPGIFKNALIGIAVCIIGVVIASILVYVLIVPSATNMVQEIFPGWDWNTQPNTTPDISTVDPNQILESSFSLLINLVIVLGVVCVFAIIATFFIRQSLNLLKEKSDVGLFGTAGTMMLVGGCLTFILIGFIIIWIAALLLAIAFFQIKNQEPNTNQYTTYQPPTPTTI